MQHQLSEQTFTFEEHEWEPACASVYHEQDNAGVVDHGGVARYFVLGPCRHTTGYRCEPAALSAMARPQGNCEQCRSFWPRERFSYFRLGA